MKQSYDDLTPQSPMVSAARGGGAASESPAPSPIAKLNFAASPSPASSPAAASTPPVLPPSSAPRSAMKSSGGKSKKKGNKGLLRFAVSNAASAAAVSPAVTETPQTPLLNTAERKTRQSARAREIMAEALAKEPSAPPPPQDGDNQDAPSMAEEEDDDYRSAEPITQDEDDNDEGAGPTLVTMTPVKGSPRNVPFVASTPPVANTLNFKLERSLYFFSGTIACEIQSTAFRDAGITRPSCAFGATAVSSN